ncbi:MAG: glycerophosphodiester phosphodiesterase [Candidatus Hodarchaeales archaeon]
MKVIAHTGYLINGDPRNSIPAFQTAVHYQADGIEFDIHLTSDKHFVCYHDYTLEKLGRKDEIKNLTQGELTSIPLNDEGVYIPSLEEILEKFGNKILLNIEIKSENGAKELVEILDQYSISKEPSKLIISSFKHKPLIEIKQIDETVPTGLLQHSPINILAVAEKLKCNAIHPFFDKIPDDYVKFHSKTITTVLHRFLSKRLYQKAKKEGLLINPWTINNESYIRRAIEMGVDGIITDELEKTFEILKGFKT